MMLSDIDIQEETIGVDCITHGRYGYTDSYGEQREYSYSSGVRCDPHTRKVRQHFSQFLETQVVIVIISGVSELERKLGANSDLHLK